MKAFVRTEDPEIRRQLPLPYEYILYRRAQGKHLLMPGALLDQPHIVTICFSIIEEEEIIWLNEKQRMQVLNSKLQQEWESNNAGK